MAEDEMDENKFIIDYLMEQEALAGVTTVYYEYDGIFDTPFLEETTEMRERYAAEILEELIAKVENITRFKEEYDAKLKAHNQYHLFKLEEKINNFKIDDAMYERLTFRETLVISKFLEGNDFETVPIGGMCIDVQKGSGSQPFQRENVPVDLQMMDAMKLEGADGYFRNYPEDDLQTQRDREQGKFLVHLSSDFDHEEKNGGSRITCWLDRNLHTLEELRREYLFESMDQLEEKKLLTLLKPHKYYVKHIDRLSEFEDRKMYSFTKTKEYISEGVNIVLMRYLAITKYIGTLELSCMYINGDMCRNIYECFGPEAAQINDHRIDVCKIHRSIIEECGITHNCVTILTLTGQIVKQDWQNCNYVLHVNPLLQITNESLPGNDLVLLQDSWVEDMQLMSRYLDDKTKCSLKMRSYLLDHPELKQLVADYVQDILLTRPPDIVDYTINHFLRFAPEYIPRYDYFDM